MKLFQLIEAALGTGSRLKLYHWSYVITSKLHCVDVLVVAKSVEEARAKIAAQIGEADDPPEDVLTRIYDQPKRVLAPGVALCLVRPVR